MQLLWIFVFPPWINTALLLQCLQRCREEKAGSTFNAQPDNKTFTLKTYQKDKRRNTTNLALFQHFLQQKKTEHCWVNRNSWEKTDLQYLSFMRSKQQLHSINKINSISIFILRHVTRVKKFVSTKGLKQIYIFKTNVPEKLLFAQIVEIITNILTQY